MRFPDFAAGRQTDLGHSPIDEAAEAKYRLKCLIKVARQGRLLDVGFGTGAFLRVARSRFDVVGLDLVVQHPPDLNGMPAFKGHLRAIPFVDGTFQVVTAFEVLEHLFEARGFLDEAYRVMTPDGILVIQTGDADSMLARLNPETWRYLLPPVHLNAFSRKALLALLGKAGFEHVKAWSFGRAPKRTPFVSRLSNPEAFRPLLNFAGRLGLIGQLHAFRKASHR